MICRTSESRLNRDYNDTTMFIRITAVGKQTIPLLPQHKDPAILFLHHQKA